MMPVSLRKHWVTLVAGAALASLVALPAPAGAHPLGAASDPASPTPIVAPAEADPRPPLLLGWAHVGPGAPVVGATVRIVTRQGASLGIASARTGRNGEFALDVADADPPRLVVVETQGGRVEGRPWRGRLRALIDMGPRRHIVHVNAATTISTAWRMIQRGRTKAAADSRVRTVLGIQRHHDVEAGLRLGTAGLDGRKIARAIERRGMSRWLASALRLMDARRSGPSYATVAGRERGSVVRGEDPIQPAGIGAIIGSLVWDDVKAAAQSCDPSGTAIPGVGYLASALNDLGIVSQDPTCGELKDVLNELNEIQQGINQIETALQQTNDQIQRIATQIALDALSNANSNLQYQVLSPIKVGQQAYTFLIDSAQTTVAEVGLPLGDILTSTDDSVRSNANVEKLRSQAAGILSQAGPLGTNFQTAVTSLVSDGIVSDAMGGSDKGVLRLTWEALMPPLAPSFIDAADLASYNNVVTYLRQINAHAAALMIDISRNSGLTSLQIMSDVVGPWQLPDTYFDGVSTELLPCPTADDTLNGYCYPLTLQDAGFADVSWDYRGPVIDPVNNLMWASVCAIPGMPVTDCDVSGILTFAYDEEDLPRWFQIPVSLSWGVQDIFNTPMPIGGTFTRPTPAQVASLKSVAQANGQQPSAMNSWLSKQGDVFTQVATAPIATSGVAWDCGWGTTNRADLSYIGTFYYACDLPQWCYSEIAGQCYTLNRIGLQHTAFVVGTDVTGRESRIGWAIPSSLQPSMLPDDAIPFANPPNAFRGSVHVTDNSGVSESTMARIISAPPTQSQAPMASTVAPLVVMPFDTTGYVLTGDAWTN